MIPEQSAVTSNEVPLSLHADSGYTSDEGAASLWAQSIIFNEAGKVIGGYFDTNKTWRGDSRLCWAATASNMLAWWQQTYHMADYLPNAPQDADDIFSIFKENWVNEGGFSDLGCHWWLAGISHATPRAYQYYRSCKGDGGSYYDGLYSPHSTTQLITTTYTRNLSAKGVTKALARELEQGSAIGLSLFLHNGKSFCSGHAVTLWGISWNEETGELTHLHVSNSDDELIGVFSVEVTYNDEFGYYRLHGYGDNLADFWLHDFDILKAPGQQGLVTLNKPTKLVINQQLEQVEFNWNIKQQTGVHYELEYRLKGSADYTLTSLSQTSASLTLPTDGIYEWRVRTCFGTEYATAWVKGKNFTYDTYAPSLTMGGYKTKKGSKGMGRITISWSSNEKANYMLAVEGGPSYKGKGSKVSFTLATGWYDYTLTATDTAGYQSELNGRFCVDYVPPPPPSSPEVELEQGGRQAKFSWVGTQDANGVTYELEYKIKKDRKYTSVANLTSTNTILPLTLDGDYSWRVRAVDGAGNTSAWVQGTAFNNDQRGPELTLPLPVMKKGAKGLVRVNLSWTSSEKATYELFIDGNRVYAGKGLKTSFMLKEGNYILTLKATDACGNNTTHTSDLLVDAVLPTLPSELRVDLQDQGKKALFCWSPSQDANGVTYELAYKEKKSKKYTYLSGITDTNTVLELPVDTDYVWQVRAIDTAGNASAWVQGNRFNNDQRGPEVLMGETSLKVLSPNNTRATLTWTCGEKANYMLRVDDKQVYCGKGNKVNFTLTDGRHHLTLTASDSQGNVTTKSDSFYIDTTPPPAPTDLRVELDTTGQCANFFWNASPDESGVTYELAIKSQKNKNYTIISNITDDFLYHWLSDITDYTWKVRAIDAHGNSSRWTQGANFHNDFQAPELTLRTPRQKQLTNGMTQVTFIWKCDEDATYVLSIDGTTVYEGNKLTIDTVLAEGWHEYTLTATDTRGNTSSKSTSILVDSTAPTAPSDFSVRLLDENGTFELTWAASQDSHQVTYDLAIKSAYLFDSYSFLNNLEGNCVTIQLPILPDYDEYQWLVQAKDTNKNTLGWIQAPSFSSSGQFTGSFLSLQETTAGDNVSTCEDSITHKTLLTCSLDSELAISAGSVCQPESTCAMPTSASIPGLPEQEQVTLFHQAMLA